MSLLLPYSCLSSCRFGFRPHCNAIMTLPVNSKPLTVCAVRSLSLARSAPTAWSLTVYTAVFAPVFTPVVYPQPWTRSQYVYIYFYFYFFAFIFLLICMQQAITTRSPTRACLSSSATGHILVHALRVWAPGQRGLRGGVLPEGAGEGDSFLLV